jgi:hypothetical protein
MDISESLIELQQKYQFDGFTFEISFTYYDEAVAISKYSIAIDSVHIS